MKTRKGALPLLSGGGGSISVTPDAAELCRKQSYGRALVLDFRELSPAGCCSAGAVVKLNWRGIEEIHNDPDLVASGDVDGVPLFCHHIIARFTAEHPIEIIARRFGPWKWLAIASDKDPAMWCFFGDGAFGEKK